MVNINQLTPALHQNDAVGESILEINRTLGGWGHQPGIFSLEVDLPLEGIARGLSEFNNFDNEDAINILHFAIPSVLTQIFKESKGKKVLIYHNITPSRFFEGINSEMVHIATVGREELSSLVKCTDFALGDSRFNEEELKEYGFSKTGVFPIPLNPERYDVESIIPLKKMLQRDEYCNILFAGRITPNKKIEDIIKSFYYFKNLFYQESRLIIVGNPSGFEGYDMYLKDLAEKLDLNDVHFTGKVDQDELVTYYKIADIFVTMSEHEGFCVPILESFLFGIPVIAYNSTAIPHTMGDGGILVNAKKHREIAGIMSEVCENDDLRKSLIQKQREQLRNFSPDKIKGYLKGIISSFI